MGGGGVWGWPSLGERYTRIPDPGRGHTPPRGGKRNCWSGPEKEGGPFIKICIPVVVLTITPPQGTSCTTPHRSSTPRSSISFTITPSQGTPTIHMYPNRSSTPQTSIISALTPSHTPSTPSTTEAEFWDEMMKRFPPCYSESPIHLCLEISISSNSRNPLQFLDFNF